MDVLTPLPGSGGQSVLPPLGSGSFSLPTLLPASGVGTGLSSPGTIGTGIFNGVFDTRSPSSRRISTRIPRGTTAKTTHGRLLDITSLTLEEKTTSAAINAATTTLSQQAGKGFIKKGVFSFGSPTEHIIFSEPLAMTMEVADMEDGRRVDVWVQHAGQPWNTDSITMNPHATCGPDGTVAKADANHITYVTSGRVTFYTCGASTFALGYVPSIDLPNNTVSTALEQTNGKIIIGGAFTTVGGVARNRIARFNTDKSLDHSFDPNANGTVTALAVQSDGKIIIGGAFTTVGGITRNRIARINLDGSLDLTFDPNANGTINTIEVDSSDNIIIGGAFTTIGGVGRNRIAKLTSTGSLDTTFNPNANNTVNDIYITTGGDILFAGLFTTIGVTARNRVAKVSGTGGLDPIFNPNANSTVSAMTLQSDGSIILVGSFTTMGGTARNYIAKVSGTGGLDPIFNPNANAATNTVAVDTQDNIILGGTFTTLSGIARNRIARVTSTGSLDTTFNPNSNNTINIIASLSTEKIFVGGLFTSIAGITQSYIAYLDNTIFDTIYNTRPNNTVNQIVTQNDGKIILGGLFTTVGGVTRNRIARITTTGGLDTTFDPNANGTISAVALQPDGNILLGGAFTTVGGVARNRIARITTTGGLDTTFNPNSNNTINAIALQPDGKIIIVGSFTTIGGVARNRIARITATGGLDTTFDPNSNGVINTVVVQPDGNILLGGAFTTIGGVARNRIARITSTGGLDTTFNPNANNTINTLGLQSDGSIIAGGLFTTIAGGSRNYLAKLTTAGTLDTVFSPSISNSVSSLLITPTDTVFAGGIFRNVNTISRTELVKLSPQGVVDENLDILFLTSGTTINALTLDTEGNLLAGGSFTIVDNNANTPYFTTIGLDEIIDTNQAMLWLDASDGTNCTTQGCSISSWKDKVFSKIGTQTVATNQPQFLLTGRNYNPSIDFLGSPNAGGSTTFDYLTFGAQGLNITNKMTIFVAHNLHTAGEHYMVGLQNGWTQRRYSNSFLQANKGFSAWSGAINTPTVSSVSVNDTSAIHYRNGSRITKNSMTGGNFVTGNALRVGGTEAGGNYSTDGDIAEIIIYNRVLTGNIRMGIESYLALKYGITMTQDYVDGSGGTIWNITTNSGYNNDIIGIGRDSRTTLQQRISISTPKDIIIATNADTISSNISTSRPSLADKSYIMVGHNGAGTGMIASYNNGENNRLSRIWKVENHNVSSGIVVAFATGSLGLPVGAPTSGLVLVISTDTNFSSGDTMIPLLSSGGYYIASTTLSDNSYFTIAHTELGAVSVSSPVSRSLPTVQASASTLNISGTSSAFFVDDRKGSTSGYTTTLTFSSLSTTGGATIPQSAISVKADALSVFSGAANPDVQIDPALSSFVATTGTLTFISRALGSGGGIVGRYGTPLTLDIIVPAYTSLGLYTGTITYTLIEN